MKDEVKIKITNPDGVTEETTAFEFRKNIQKVADAETVSICVEQLHRQGVLIYRGCKFTIEEKDKTKKFKPTKDPILNRDRAFGTVQAFLNDYRDLCDRYGLHIDVAPGEVLIVDGGEGEDRLISYDIHKIF
jgi:hypothetical protein